MLYALIRERAMRERLKRESRESRYKDERDEREDQEREKRERLRGQVEGRQSAVTLTTLPSPSGDKGSTSSS